MTYCPLCRKEVDQLHFEIEKWLLNTIIKEHPDWIEKDGTCKQCLDYYKALDDLKTVGG